MYAACAAALWRGLTQSNVVRVVASLSSADPAVEVQFKPEIADTTAKISEIQKRVDAAQRLVNITIVILIVTLLLAGYAFYTFYLVTRGGLRLISQHLQEMAGGDLRLERGEDVVTGVVGHGGLQATGGGEVDVGADQVDQRQGAKAISGR